MQVGAAMKHSGGNTQLVRDCDGFARVTQLLQWAALTFADHDRPDGPPPGPHMKGEEAATAAPSGPLDAPSPMAAPGAHGEARQLQVGIRCLCLVSINAIALCNASWRINVISLLAPWLGGYASNSTVSFCAAALDNRSTRCRPSIPYRVSEVGEARSPLSRTSITIISSL